MKQSMKALAALAVVGTLAGCAGSDVAEPSSPEFTKIKETTAKEITPEKTTSEKETTESSSTPPTTRKSDTPVNPANYERAGMSVFTYDVGDFSGTCAISPHGATCQGVTPNDAPMVTAVPLPPRKADAIYAGEDGMHFTVFEGVGPSQGRIDPGQSITINENSCAYPDDETLRCVSGANSFTVHGDGEITTDGQLDQPPVWTLPDYY